MSGNISHSGRHFTFELEVEISSPLALSPGELGNLILDGLFELDSNGGFFPAVTVPGAGERLLAADIKATGYRRSVEREGLGAAKSQDNTVPEAPVNTEDVAMMTELKAAYIDMEDVLAEQRMLRAKIMGLEELYGSSGPVSEEDRAKAQRALAAYKALIRHHRRSTIFAL